MLVDLGFLPSVHEGDIVTIPLGLAGLALLASAPRLPTWRRAAGAGLTLAAIHWPVSTSEMAGPVVVSLGKHGIHRYECWRSSRRWPQRRCWAFTAQCAGSATKFDQGSQLLADGPTIGRRTPPPRYAR
jgi:hypothetical protein